MDLNLELLRGTPFYTILVIFIALKLTIKTIASLLFWTAGFCGRIDSPRAKWIGKTCSTLGIILGVDVPERYLSDRYLHRPPRSKNNSL